MTPAAESDATKYSSPVFNTKSHFFLHQAGTSTNASAVVNGFDAGAEDKITTSGASGDLATVWKPASDDVVIKSAPHWDRID